ARHLAADAAEPDDSKCFAGDFRSLEPAFLPFAAFQRQVSLRNTSSQSKKHGDGVFGGRGGGTAGRIHHEDTAFCSSFDIDVVHADSGASDNLEAGRVLDQFAIDRRCAADNNAVNVSNKLQQFL